MPSKKHQLNVPRVTALCYIRQSYTRDTNDMNSPERQRANIQAACDKNGWPPEWYEDAEGHKSGRDVKDRPNWLALEARLGDPDVAALVANDLSRLHRKSWRIGYLMELLDKHDIHLVLAAPGREVDTSTPWGRMFVSMMAMQDEAYAADIAQRAKDSIAYRKAQGKTVGMPPFGTIRNEEGYLEPSLYGAWLLPNGHYTPGHIDDDPPEPGALWRGYHECAQRILEVYAENKKGIERIAYQMTDEGWVFRDRKKQPRTINRDDVRRVVANWRQYAGLSPVGRAKDQNASMIDNPTDILYDTGRNVFPFELIERVATVQEARSVTSRPFGSVKEAHHYPLTRLLWCAQCERNAIEHNNPKLRSRLSGVDQYGKLRYRHAEGVKCGCKRRSVFTHVIEDDFKKLIGVLSIREDKLPLLVEMAIQAEHNGLDPEEEDIERQKKAAIAKLRRKIEAARFLFSEGDISREEYVKRKTDCEREIAHWEARTTDTQKAAIELQMCMEALNLISSVWDESSDEDRQQLARMMFEEIIYDLDQQRIVHFTLKPWAERFLDLRMALRLMEQGEPDDDDDPGAGDGVPANSGDGDDSGDSQGKVSGEIAKRSHLKDTSVLCPIGGSRAENGPALKSVNSAVSYILAKLNAQPAPPDPTLTTKERNIIIRARYAVGVSQAELARQFGISYQRVHQIVHGRRK
jgi:DNA invertase Pin-like site-specific DNA recombinase